MKGRQLVAGIIGAVSAAAAGNRLLDRRVDPLGPPLERETGTYRWRGMNVAYTEGGDPENPDMVLLHGIHRAGSSREFNRVFERLAETHHVFAPDLPGFGRSDRPPLRYSSTLYQAFLEDLLTDLTEAPVVVGSGLSASYVVAAASHLEVSQLVLTCPTTRANPRNHRITAKLLRVPVLGETSFNAMTTRQTLRWYARRRLLDDDATLSEHDLDYFWQAAHQPGARYPVASMLAGDLDVDRDIATDIADLAIPTTLVWGRNAVSPSLLAGRQIADTSSSKLVAIDQTGVLPHFEQPGAFFEVLADELEVPG